MADHEFNSPAVQAEWLFQVRAVEGLQLDAELMRRVAESAALLLKIAQADPSPDAAAVQAWLNNMGRSATMARCALETVL
ncbi:hypothetical protein [Paracidovorax citrulli]|uniref:hypothetical protein n=1 Tax=Paracidovorax citrulli TaxID=80869 RepID=UPI000ACF6037|nr:hypothetical protein [Paracidovorax citrulli]